jgi:hypothetical protein
VPPMDGRQYGGLLHRRHSRAVLHQQSQHRL